MDGMESFVDVIDSWPSLSDLASDIGRKYDTVCKWRSRGKIPDDAWQDLLIAARRRRIRLNASDLIALSAQKPYASGTNGV